MCVCVCVRVYTMNVEAWGRGLWQGGVEVAEEKNNKG